MERKGVGFLETALETIYPGLGDGLEAVAKKMMQESLELVPVDTGALRSSGTGVDEGGNLSNPEEFVVEQGSNELSLTFGYAIGAKGDIVNEDTGRTVSTYAVDVHEQVDVYHAPPTRAKYLEDPVHTDADQMGDYLTIAVRERIK